MRRWASALLGLCLFSATAHAAVNGRHVRLDALEGAPRDSVERAAFIDAFDDVLARECPPGARDCPIVLDTASHPDSVWHLSVVVAVPPQVPQKRVRMVRPVGGGKPRRVVTTAPKGQRSTRGLTVVVAVLSPSAYAAGARPLPTRSGVSFPGQTTEPYPFAEAGATAARLALEALFAIDAPEEVQGFDLSPARRVEDPR